MELVDTNVFVRHIVRDDVEKADRALAYFDGLFEGPARATVTEATVAEVLYVVGSPRYYAFSRSRIVEALRAILALPGFTIAHPSAVERALAVYESTNIDFVDALNVAHAERLGADAIVSFDRDYDRFPSVIRREP